MPSWHEISLGTERAQQLITRDSVCLFGLGPAGAEPPREERVAQLLERLHPELRAIRWCNQVHGRLLASLADEPADPLAGVACVGRCDGLLTDELGLGALVWTADCVPVLLAGDGVIAAVHAGWRGTAAGIVPQCLRRLQVEYGVEPHRVAVWLGPAVGPCHYQVGPEVIEGLRGWQAQEDTWLHDDRVDLRAFLKEQLLQAGVTGERVWRSDRCTACDPQLASYRRDGTAAGRQWSLIYRTAARHLPDQPPLPPPA